MTANPKTFPSRRSPVIARRGMVAASQPLAALEGLRVLMDGGNAADAAVTVAAMLNVVEPMSTGIGGDAFALVYWTSTPGPLSVSERGESPPSPAGKGVGGLGQVSALNASGRAPEAFTRTHSNSHPSPSPSEGEGRGEGETRLPPSSQPSPLRGLGQVFALNASGRAPEAFTLEVARKMGLREIPSDTALAVTVPGTVSGWDALLRRFGTMSLGECLRPAIRAAEEGFAVTPVIARDWRSAADKLSRDPAAARAYLPAPGAGDIHRQPDLARSLRLIAEGGADAFYRGPLARQIAARVQELGGFLTADDFTAHAADWGEAIRSAYRGVEICEHPPNGQGIAALVALNILQGDDIGGMGYWDPERWHRMVEAVRLGLDDAVWHVADPHFADVPVERLLSREHADSQRARIRPGHALDLRPPAARSGDTVYLTVVDGAGNAVSLINSLYQQFGAGFVVPGTGICLHNRGAGFSLQPGHPNALAGGKRPYHTIIPALALRNGRLWLSFGVMGAFMQPQGHVQVLTNMVDFGMDPQAALDGPRFRVDERGSRRLAVETGAPLSLRKALAAMGYDVQPASLWADGRFGGGQVIAVDADSGALWGGSDPRKDGCAVGF